MCYNGFKFAWLQVGSQFAWVSNPQARWEKTGEFSAVLKGGVDVPLEDIGYESHCVRVDSTVLPYNHV